MAAVALDAPKLDMSRGAWNSFGVVFFILGIFACLVIGAYLYVALAGDGKDTIQNLIALATAILFVLVGVACVFFATIIPEEWKDIVIKYKSFAWALVVFEIATLFGAQMHFINTEKALMEAQQTNIQLLRDKLDRHKAIGEAAAVTAKTQGQSTKHAISNSAADLIRRSILQEGRADADRKELLQAQENYRPPITAAYGEYAVHWALLRSVLLSMSNIMMFGASGLCFRQARVSPGGNSRARSTHREEFPDPEDFAAKPPPPEKKKEVTLKPNGDGSWSMAGVVLGAGTAATVGSLVPTPVQAAVPAAPVPPPVFKPVQPPPLPADETPKAAGPVQVQPAGGPVQVQVEKAPSSAEQPSGGPKAVQLAEAQPVSVQSAKGARSVESGPQVQPPTASGPESVQPRSVGEQMRARRLAGEDAKAEKAPKPRKKAVAAANPGNKIDTGVGELDGYRYRRVMAALIAGTCEPSVEAIQKQFGGGRDTIRGYQAAMVAEGVLERVGDWVTAPYRLTEKYRKALMQAA